MFALYLLNILSLIAILAILALSIDFALGQTGLVNLGQVAISGIGAYTSAILTLRYDVPFLLAILIAVILSGAVGFLLSWPSRKVKGDYYSLLTLAFAFIFITLALNLKNFTRGALGIPGIPRPDIFNDPFLYFLFVIFCLALVYAFFERVSKGPFGRVQGAIRDDETAALALGKNTGRVKQITLTFSGAAAGLAGVLLGHFVQFIDPASFGLPDLVTLLAAVIVGGVASRKGAVLGALFIYLILEPIRFLPLPPEMVGVVRQGGFALILLLIILFRPRGVLGTIDL